MAIESGKQYRLRQGKSYVNGTEMQDRNRDTDLWWEDNRVEILKMK
jgi:hypothetical protein